MFSLTVVSDATNRTSGLEQGTLFGTRETEKTMSIKKFEEEGGAREKRFLDEGLR